MPCEPNDGTVGGECRLLHVHGGDRAHPDPPPSLHPASIFPHLKPYKSGGRGGFSFQWPQPPYKWTSISVLPKRIAVEIISFTWWCSQTPALIISILLGSNMDSGCRFGDRQQSVACNHRSPKSTGTCTHRVACAGVAVLRCPERTAAKPAAAMSKSPGLMSSSLLLLIQ
ncbi:hypothetical protein B296_00055711 [Ensete ventricosum]|uniref:Uncharacterized protein n=1 Tax=Ensete ventricosum TaxID=4639 RepID=A0A426XI93_ENSVE|nr:hypothetical protein B296_00055711 [Ensete ventricosum]